MLTLLFASVAFLLTLSEAKEDSGLRLAESAAGMETGQSQIVHAEMPAATPALKAPDTDTDTTGDGKRPEEAGQSRGPATFEGAEAVQADAPAGHVVAQASSKPWRGREEPGKTGTASKPARETGSAVSRPWRSGEESADKARETSATLPQATSATDGQTRGQATGTSPKTVRLFGTMAFRGNFDALPKWKRVLSKADAQVRALDSCTSGKGCPPGTASWQRIMSQARGLGPMEQLKTVNTFFNKWPYRLDQDVYGTSDWWATPQEFLKLSGDCEDYAITKYYALRDLGHSPDNLRIVVLRDRIRGIAHAILVVILDGDAYVLDNVSSVVFSHDKYSHYVPYYSLNEKYRWSHIPVDKKP